MTYFLITVAIVYFLVGIPFTLSFASSFFIDFRSNIKRPSNLEFVLALYLIIVFYPFWPITTMVALMISKEAVIDGLRDIKRIINHLFGHNIENFTKKN